jgi:hypothetical protein
MHTTASGGLNGAARACVADKRPHDSGKHLLTINGARASMVRGLWGGVMRLTAARLESEDT